MTHFWRNVAIYIGESGGVTPGMRNEAAAGSKSLSVLQAPKKDEKLLRNSPPTTVIKSVIFHQRHRDRDAAVIE